MVTKDEAEANGMGNDEDTDLDNITAQVNNLTLLADEENEENVDNALFSLKNPVFDFNRKSTKVNY